MPPRVTQARKRKDDGLEVLSGIVGIGGDERDPFFYLFLSFHLVPTLRVGTQWTAALRRLDTL